MSKVKQQPLSETMRRFLQTDPKEVEELERKEKEKKKSKSDKKGKK